MYPRGTIVNNDQHSINQTIKMHWCRSFSEIYTHNTLYQITCQLSVQSEEIRDARCSLQFFFFFIAVSVYVLQRRPRSLSSISKDKCIELVHCLFSFFQRRTSNIKEKIVKYFWMFDKNKYITICSIEK